MTYASDVMRLVERKRREADESEALTVRVRAALPELVRIPVEEFGARRVVLFGSAAGGRLTPESDLDLLVEGLAAEDQGTARGRLFLCSPLPVELVRVETARPSVLARATERGEVLHGR